MSLFFAFLIAVVCAVAYVGVLWLIRKLVRGTCVKATTTCWFRCF